MSDVKGNTFESVTGGEFNLDGGTFRLSINGEEVGPPIQFQGGVWTHGVAPGFVGLSSSSAPLLKPAALGPWTDLQAYRRELLARAAGKPTLIYMGNAFLPNGQPRKPYKVESRIAIINVSGVLANEAWYWDETSYRSIQHELNYAASDGDVDGVLLRINSPGGYTDGAYETADAVRKVGKVKPVWAVAAPMAYSAAYLIASQAGRIYVPEVSGGVGSIGVYCIHFDMSDMLTEWGVKPTIIEAGEGKTDGNPYEPLSERAKNDLQADVDRLYAAFVANVSRGRGLKESEIIALGAYTYDGARASIEAGLADKTGTPEVAIATMSKETGNRSISIPLATAGGEERTRMNPQETGAPGQQPTTPAATMAPPAAAAAPVTPAAPAGTVAVDAYKADQAMIRDLCALAGCPAKALEFQEKNLTVEQVRAELFKEKRNGQAGEVNATVSGLAGAAKPKASLKERMIKRLEAKGIKPAERGV